MIFNTEVDKRHDDILLSLTNNLHRLIFTFKLSPDGQMSFPYISSGIRKLYGLQLENSTEDFASIHDLAHPSDRAKIEEVIAKSAKNLEPFYLTYRINVKGEEKWIETRSIPEKLEDGTILWHGTMFDFTQKKALEYQMSLLASTVYHSGEAFYIIDPSKDFQFIFVNSAACNMTGYTKEELLKMKSFDLGLNIKQEKLDEIGNSFMQNKSFYFETKHHLKDGSVIDVEVHTYKIIFDEKSLYIAFVHDITKRKAQEEELRKKEREFHSLAENIPDNIARWDKKGHYLYLNPIHEDTVGVSSSEIIGKPISNKFLSVKEAITQVVASKEKIIVQQEILKENGKIEIHDISLVPEFDTDGKVISVLGVGRDMTDIYDLQDAISAREKEFRTLVENLPDNIIRYNTACQAIFVSPTMKRVYGDEAVAMIIGKTPQERAFNGHIPEQYQQAIEKVLASGEKAELDIEAFPPSGDKQYHHIRFVPERNNKGEICSVLAIGHDITSRKMIEKKMEYMAHHDILTDLPNRIIAQKKTEEAILIAKQNHSKVALLFFDLDGFKTINDSLGHSIGDEMLKKVATRIKECEREDLTICRHGGDEFLIILPEINEIKDVIVTVEKLLSGFEKSFDVENHILSISASIGVSLYPDNGNTFEALLKNADLAMYKAKENGKNTYCVYDIKMSEHLIKELKIQNNLKKAIKNNEFVLYYQPQIDLKLNRITGAEALIRWKHPLLGMILPLDFIPIAESTGLIVQIGEWVIMEACRQAALWAKEGMEITVAVNISAVQFKRGDLAAIIKKALLSSKLNPKLLELELTESVMAHNVEATLKMAQTLKALGIKLSIDDFGTGYSSLSYLKRFAVDKLKIDQSFVRDILKDKDDEAIVKTIIQMAKNLNLKTIAEGVEDEDVLQVINSLGCDEVQGFYFAKPMEAVAFEKYQSRFR
ncbi:EAL domain-containing protein [Sulfurospirillum arcachonense]|uniref:EAL domain-containing protein n=1 Tax=Sulfurospirillum arcachonense TaxID=57666 RepID=UPI0004686A8E|nr:EAL domain-containing protein [Sulfurospirillum arcachonense]